MMKCLGERDFSAQETLHLLSIKLCSSTFKVLPISLNGSRRINLAKHSETDFVTKDSIIDTYAQREKFLNSHQHIMDMNLFDFVTTYKICKTKLEKQSSKMVPRFSPHIQAIQMENTLVSTVNTNYLSSNHGSTFNEMHGVI